MLKKISFDDYPILLDWANDPITRSSSFNTDIIDVEEHKEFIKSVIEDKNKNQFIFYIDNQPLEQFVKKGCQTIILSYHTQFHQKIEIKILVLK